MLFARRIVEPSPRQPSRRTGPAQCELPCVCRPQGAESPRRGPVPTETASSFWGSGGAAVTPSDPALTLPDLTAGCAGSGSLGRNPGADRCQALPVTGLGTLLGAAKTAHGPGLPLLGRGACGKDQAVHQGRGPVGEVPGTLGPAAAFRPPASGDPRVP